MRMMWQRLAKMAGVGVHGAEHAGGVAGVAGFFGEFAHDGGGGIFTSLDHAAGKFPRELRDAEAVLLHQHELAGGGDGQGYAPVGRFDDEEFFAGAAPGMGEGARGDGEDARRQEGARLAGSPRGGGRG